MGIVGIMQPKAMGTILPNSDSARGDRGQLRRQTVCGIEDPEPTVLWRLYARGELPVGGLGRLDLVWERHPYSDAQEGQDGYREVWRDLLWLIYRNQDM